VQAIKTYGGEEVQIHAFLISVLDEVSGQITPRPFYPWEKALPAD